MLIADKYDFKSNISKYNFFKVNSNSGTGIEGQFQFRNGIDHMPEVYS